MSASDKDRGRLVKCVSGASVRDILDAAGLTIADIFIPDRSARTLTGQRHNTPGPNTTHPQPVASRVKSCIVGLGIAGWLSQRATDRLLRLLRLQSA